MCLPFCAHLCIMKGKVGGGEKKRTQLLFLVAIYGIFLSRCRPICGFSFSDERISFPFPFVSLIDFCNNFSLFCINENER